MKYVDLVIDNKSDNTDHFYTYGCEDDRIQVGNKVLVPFARGNKEREAYVFRVFEEPEEEIKNLKYVHSVCTDFSLSEEAVETCKWMRRRYLCRYIDAVKVFTPMGKPLKSGKTREPFKDEKGEHQPISSLTEEQESALQEICEAIHEDRHDIFLLHGVTGSGKTEVYMQAIGEALYKGKTAIMLVPEISLTKQIIDRFIGRFGSQEIAVLHSRLSLGERYDQWMRIREGKVKIVIGARSAVFAPFDNIGVIVIDEEHESTYKSDMTPKYETMEVAIIRAKANKGIVLAGSATPSVVSYSRCEEGIYKKLTLKERYNRVALPQVDLVDMRQELREGNRSVLSRELYLGMSEVLDQGKQVILFLNRRGYSTFVSCRECGYVVKCKDCDISLTHHKERNACVCHYCGHVEAAPVTCPQCGSPHIRYFGTGTEKLEEAVGELFENKKVGRLDLDTIRRKGSLEKILNDFGKGKIDILTGTQIVAKGLDFRNVGMVGIVSADVTLNIPDYRSAERTFQLITQAAGRAGRGDEVGRVVIQTYTPDNYAILAAADQNYQTFYEREIQGRKWMQYPPFGDIIQVVFSSKLENECRLAAEYWEKELKGIGVAGGSVLPPQRMIGTGDLKLYREYVLIKSPKGMRNVYMGFIEGLKNAARGKKYTVMVDVNPYSMWRS